MVDPTMGQKHTAQLSIAHSYSSSEEDSQALNAALFSQLPH